MKLAELDDSLRQELLALAKEELAEEGEVGPPETAPRFTCPGTLDGTGERQPCEAGPKGEPYYNYTLAATCPEHNVPVG